MHSTSAPVTDVRAAGSLIGVDGPAAVPVVTPRAAPPLTAARALLIYPTDAGEFEDR
jgi:hypothetical protein